ncbi:MAG: JAB domain-containing protein, partial [Ruminococcus sp.]|nr:JAB domain-containing protein [Ruminococcus sp.]
KRNVEISNNIIKSYCNLHTILDSNIPFIMKEYKANVKTIALLSLIPGIVNIFVFSPCKDMNLNTIKNAKKYFSALLRKSKKEAVAVVAVNKNFKIICSKIISHGNLTNVGISYRKVAEFALENDADYIFLSHCHPSDNSAPSQEDVNVTIRLKKVLEILDIPLVDHIISGRDGTYSMFEEFGTKIFSDIPKYKNK